MSLIPKITVNSTDEVAAAHVKIQDSTGAYNATTNPGGFGAPNPLSTDVVKVILRAQHFSADDTEYTETEIEDPTDIIGAEYTLSGPSGLFADGVWILKGFYVVDTALSLSWETDALYITLPSANTLLAGAVAVLINDTLYLIDYTTPPDGSGFYVLASPGTAGVAVTGNPVFQSTSYFLIGVAGNKCLVKTIAARAAAGNCDCDEDDNRLIDWFGKKESRDELFELEYYEASNDLALELEAACATSTPCSC